MATEVQTKESPKSWSRELAVALIIGLGVLIYAEKQEMVQIVIYPVSGFVFAAFMPNKLQQLQSFRSGK